jgi:DNA-binding HxlR family transcriptional regulator
MRTLYSPCPTHGRVDIVGRKWSICAVMLLGRYGALPFGVIQQSLVGSHSSVLGSHLRDLERAGLVARRRLNGKQNSGFAYELTTLGDELYRALTPLADWLRQR